MEFWFFVYYMDKLLSCLDVHLHWHISQTSSVPYVQKCRDRNVPWPNRPRPKRLRPKWLRPKRPDRIGQTEWSCTRFLHPYESNFPFIPVLSTRIIRAPLLPGRHCRVSIPETQTCLHVLFLLSAYNTIHTTPGTTTLVTGGTRSPARTKSVVRGPVLKITLAWSMSTH